MTAVDQVRVMSGMPIPTEREIITLLFAVLTFAFLMAYRREIKHVRHFNILVIGFTFLVVGWTSTVADNFVFYELVNLIEHAAYALGMWFITIWAWKFSSEPRAHS